MAASSSSVVARGSGHCCKRSKVVEEEDHSYKTGHSMAGILYSSGGLPNFKFLHATTHLPSLIIPSFLTTELATMCASSSGLILYRLDNSSSSTMTLPQSSSPSAADCYHIHNPFPVSSAEQEDDVMSHASISIPSMHQDHSSSPPTALALVVDCSNQQGGPAFHIVRACCKFSGLSSYYMDEYSSATGEWRRYGHFDLAAGIIPNTAVSCARKAYWLAKSSSVIEYNTRNHKARTFLLPWRESAARRMTPHPGPPRQLGKAGGQLCFILVTEATVEVYLLEPGSDNWILYHKVAVNIVSSDAPLLYSGGRESPVVCREKPQPMRFESFKVEVLLWVDGRIVIVEDGRLGNPPADQLPERVSVVPFEGGAVPDSLADCLPIVSTPLLTARDFKLQRNQG